MIKITVEEIEILVTARVEDNLRQNMPKIKAMVEKIRQQFEKVDTSGFDRNIKQSLEQAGNEIKRKAPQIKEAFNGIVDNKSKQQIIDLEKEVDRLEKQINSKKMKLDITSNAISNIYDAEENRQRMKAPNATDNVINNRTMLGLSQNDNYNSLIADSDKLASSINKDNVLLDATRSRLNELRMSSEEVGSTQGRWASYSENFKSTLSNAKSQLKELMRNFKDKAIEKFKKAIKSIPSALSKVKNKIKETFGGKHMQGGLKQILRYAGGLLSIRGIYSALRQSASAWLSSQNSQAQQLSANINYMKYAMGSALAPVIQFVTNLVYNLMKAIQSVVYALFKVNIFAKASASAMKTTAGNTKKAKDEAKQLAGVHDEINNISDKNANSGSGGDGSVAPSFDLTKVDTSIFDKLKNLDFEELGGQLGEKLNQALEKIPWDKIKEKTNSIVSKITGFLNGFIEKADFKLIGKTFAEGLNTIIGAGYTFVTEFKWSKFGTKIGETVNGFFSNLDWAKAGKTLGDGIKGIFDAITGFFTEFDWSTIVDGLFDFIKNFDWKGVSDSIFEALGSACASLVNLGMILGGYIKDAFTNISQYFNDKIEECGGNVVAGIFKGIGDAISNVGSWINEHIFQPFINGFKNVFGIHSPSTVMATMGGYIIDGLKNGIKGIWDKVKEIFTGLKDKIKEKFNEIKDKVKEIAGNIKDGVKEKFTGMKDKAVEVMTTMKTKVKTKASEIWNAIKTTFANIPNWFKDKFSTAWQKVKDVFSKGGKVFQGIKEGILSTFKKIVNGLIDGINKVIKIPFDGINKALKKIKDVNIFGAKPFDFIQTINIPQIPKLAKGNVATKETLAIFGEYAGAKSNPEITAPQNVLKETFREELNNSNGTGQIKIYLNVGNKKLGDILIDDLRDRKRRTGNGIEAWIGG